MSAPASFVAYIAALESRLAALEAKLGASSTPRTHYSQADGHRPAFLPTRVLFLRAWRERRDLGDEGAFAVGKTRVLTTAAAERWLAQHRKSRGRERSHLVAVRDVDRDLDRELGIKTRVGAVR